MSKNWRSVTIFVLCGLAESVRVEPASPHSIRDLKVLKSDLGLLFGADKEESKRARLALEEISQKTGGVAYFPNSIEDVDSIATEVARDIRNQFTVGYHSTKPASMGGYRVVHVEAKGPI